VGCTWTRMAWQCCQGKLSLTSIFIHVSLTVFPTLLKYPINYNAQKDNNCTNKKHDKIWRILWSCEETENPIGMVMKSSILWDIKPYSLLKVNLQLGGTFRLGFCLLPVSRWCLAWFILRATRWRRHGPPKIQFLFNGLRTVMSQMTELFIVSIVISVMYRRILKYKLSKPWECYEERTVDNARRNAAHHVQRSFRAWSQTSCTYGSYWIMMVFST
jgi:hypothetical protein